MKPKPPKTGTREYLIHQADERENQRFEVYKDGSVWRAMHWQNGVLIKSHWAATHHDALTWANERTRNAA